METIYKQEIKMRVRGVTFPVSIRVKVEQDEGLIDGSFDFGNEKENAAYLERFARGELVSLFVQVIASGFGESEFDSLGGCHVTAGNYDKEILAIVKDHNMIENAKTLLKQRLLERAQQLSVFVGGKK